MRVEIKFILALAAWWMCGTVVHGQSCKGTQTFKKINITTKNVITWEVDNDCSNAVYEIKEFRWNKWILVGVLNSKGTGTHDYTFSHDGICDLYKIRIELKGNRKCRSVPFENASAPPITQFSQGLNDITFSSSTRYEIYSTEGLIVLKGCGAKVRVAGLKKGTYYLNYGKEMGKFTRK